MKPIWRYILTILISVVLSLIIFQSLNKKQVTQVYHSNPGRDLVLVAEQSKAAVVFITAEKTSGSAIDTDPPESFKTGSGVIITQDGFIITNYHVISGMDEINVLLESGYGFKARVMGSDSSYDIALLKIASVGLPFLPFGNSDSVRVGQQILAIGNPLRMLFSVTSGIISGLHRDLKVPGNKTSAYIQIDAATSDGSSGGAVVNVHGQLIGVPVAILSSATDQQEFAFAIPSNIVSRIVFDLIEHGALVKGSLGMAIRKVTEEIAELSGMDEIYGVVVDAVEVEGAADLAGIWPLDVILSVNGTRIKSTADFQEKWRSYYPGDTLAIVVNRQGVLETVQLVIQQPKPEQ